MGKNGWESTDLDVVVVAQAKGKHWPADHGRNGETSTAQLHIR